MKTALIYNPEIKNYNFGKDHPFTPERFENFVKFAKQKISNFDEIFEHIMPEPANQSDLELFHDKKYIDVIKKASDGIRVPNIINYVTADNLNPATGYLPKGIHQASTIAVGSSVKGAELVYEGKFQKATVMGGGLHHAKKDKGEGFCVYNDVVIAAKKLLQKGAKKILILDTDAHAGNGTSEAFYNDPGVLFIDIHQHPSTIYPGTGFENEIGEEKGKGLTVNVPLLPGASDKSYEYVFDEIIFPVVFEFKPEIIIRNGGSDPYFEDILTNLGLTFDGFEMIGKKVRQLADSVCNGKEVDLLASGYDQKALPLAWLSLVTGLLGLNIQIKEPRVMVLSKNFRLKETKEMAEELKNHLKDYWKCFK
jgi:acetoin utilization protein AcuC